MKIASGNRSIERVGVGQSTRFTIEAAGKAFEILSSGLYKDKILAIVRELSTNAYDSHVAAGCPEKTFNVHLPNSLERYFSIRDFGTGLSDQQIRTIYTTYFHSTKTDSNDFVGALGLGSKSPFSYTDSFTVRSFHNGYVRTYVAFKNEDGCPDLDELGIPDDVSIAVGARVAAVEAAVAAATAAGTDVDAAAEAAALSVPVPEWLGMPTTEANGLEITVTVDRSADYAEFTRRAQAVYEHFDPLPVVTGVPDFKPNSAEVIAKGNGWSIRKTGDRYGYNGARAVMGRIAYPIHAASVPGLPTTSSALLGIPIDIEFEMGTLEFTAGREELSYDKRITLPNLKTTLARVARDISRQISEEFDGIETEIEARRKYGKYFSNGGAFATLLRSGQIEVVWKGTKITSSAMAFSIKDYPGLVFSTYSRNYYGSGMSCTSIALFSPKKGAEHMPSNDYTKPFLGSRLTYNSSFNIDMQHPLKIYRNDIKRGATTRFRDNIKLPAQSTYNYYGRSSVVEGHVVVSGDDAVVDKFIAAMEGCEVVLASSLAPPKAERVRRKAKVRVMSDHCKENATVNINQLDEVDVDLDAGGYYIITKSGRVSGLEEGENFAKLWAHAYSNKLFDQSKPIVVAPATLAATVTDSDGEWVDIFKEIREKSKKLFEDKVAKVDWDTYYGYLHLENCYNFRQRFGKIMKIAKYLPKTHPFNVYGAEVEAAKSVYSDVHEINHLASVYHITLPKSDDKNRTALLDKWTALTRGTYGLLPILIEQNIYRDFSRSEILAVVDYINEKDRSQKMFDEASTARRAAITPLSQVDVVAALAETMP